MENSTALEENLKYKLNWKYPVEGLDPVMICEPAACVSGSRAVEFPGAGEFYC